MLGNEYDPLIQVGAARSQSEIDYITQQAAMELDLLGPSSEAARGPILGRWPGTHYCMYRS